MVAILGICILCEKLSTGKRIVWINISGLQIGNLKRLSSGIVTGWRGWRSGQRWRSWQWWCQLCSWLSASVGWRWTCVFASPACLRIPSRAILAMKGSICLVLTKHGQVSFCCSLHLFMPWTLNTPLLLFLDFCARFLNLILIFLSCSWRKPAFGHFAHIKGEAHVGLFQLHLTSLPCHCSRHVHTLKKLVPPLTMRFG